MAEFQKVPKLARHARLREDKARGGWVLNGPERVFQLDDIALAIVREIDGTASVAMIAQTLADRYDAPARVIQDDVISLLNQLADKAMIIWQ